MNASSFHVNTGMPPPLASIGEALSMREKVSVNVKVVRVDADAERLDGCRVGGVAAPAATTGVSWC